MPHKDREKNRAYSRQYRIDNADSIREKKRLYDLAHRDQINAKQTAWRHKNIVVVRQKNRVQVFKRKYGFTPAAWQDLVNQREGKCDLCGNVPKRRLHVDHDHLTNRIRGLLCCSCNTGLGKLGDTVAGLQKAIVYLETNTPIERGSV